jgi:hypothetical protein
LRLSAPTKSNRLSDRDAAKDADLEGPFSYRRNLAPNNISRILN